MHMKWLWPVHAIHHSDPVVNALTTYRIHALKSLVMWSSYTILLTWLGLPADAIGVGALILLLHNVYVHIDVDWGHGPLRMLVASPRFHRWHHADMPEAYGKNSQHLPVLTGCSAPIVFPARATPPGAAGVPRNDVVQLTLWPLLEWSQMATRRVQALRTAFAGWRCVTTRCARRSRSTSRRNRRQNPS